MSSISFVYELRREGRIEEAYHCARNLYQQDPADNDIKKALSWTLIDLCKKYISENRLDQAQLHYNQLSSLQFDWEDSFVETIRKQTALLKPKIDIHFTKIQQAEELSKAGDHKEAFTLLEAIIANNQLSTIHHDSYGWIIYRYLKAEVNNLSSVEVRTLLRDYIHLKNSRPSLLHSILLYFALSYSRDHDDFNLYKFFLLWKPAHFRYEDLIENSKDGKEFPSLIARVCKEFVNKSIVFNIEEVLISSLTLPREAILDFFREPVFWNLMNLHKTNNVKELWQSFDAYNTVYSKYGKSKWHSEILKLAERSMTAKDEKRFFYFFQNWDPHHFRDQDWKETQKEDMIFKPLAIKAIKKAFKIAKEFHEETTTWLLQPYEKAIQIYPDDEWLLREKALLHLKNKELETAIHIYKQLTAILPNTYYIWGEFSYCFTSNNRLQLAMLSKAVSIEYNEDFLQKIRLSLAKCLIKENLPEAVLVELEVHKKYQESKGWNLSPEFEKLYSSIIPKNTFLSDNKQIYNHYILLAESFAYAEYDWIEMVLTDNWEDEKGKTRSSFTNRENIRFSTNKSKFPILEQAQPGDIFKFKLYSQEIKKETEPTSWSRKSSIKEYNYIPLMIEKSDKPAWEVLEDIYAIVDYIHPEKNMIHALTSDHKKIFFPSIDPELNAGDFIKAKFYRRKPHSEEMLEIRQIKKINKEEAYPQFPCQVGIVDHINEQKQLFHFVINTKLQGVIRYSQTRIRPQEGDFLKVYYTSSLNKNNQFKLRICHLLTTKEESPTLRKSITGLLKVKYKSAGRSLSYEEALDEQEKENLSNRISSEPDNRKFSRDKTNKLKPDFAFIEDYYVPSCLLEKHSIYKDCEVEANILFNGEKWKVFKIKV